MIQFTIDDFYTSILNIVKNSDTELPCEQFNSFVIINDKFDFDKDFVAGKKINPYFFSRSGNSISYPVVAISEVNDVVSDYKNSRYGKYCHRFEIGVLDRHIENCTNCKPCDKRKLEEIFRDSSKLLANLLTLISTINVYVAQPDAVLSFMPKPLIDAYVTSTQYTSYVEDVKYSNILKHNFSSKNPTIELRRIQLPKSKLVGMFAIITICEICHDDPMTFKVRNVSNAENCC